ncbi:MAG: hypothetical protein IBX55_00240 [Methyloprofundus sp.]|nr:hypothetical protein [Methyloprofundus sp.]
MNIKIEAIKKKIKEIDASPKLEPIVNLLQEIEEIEVENPETPVLNSDEATAMFSHIQSIYPQEEDIKDYFIVAFMLRYKRYLPEDMDIRAEWIEFFNDFLENSSGSSSESTHLAFALNVEKTRELIDSMVESSGLEGDRGFYDFQYEHYPFITQNPFEWDKSNAENALRLITGKDLNDSENEYPYDIEINSMALRLYHYKAFFISELIEKNPELEPAIDEIDEKLSSALTELIQNYFDSSFEFEDPIEDMNNYLDTVNHDLGILSDNLECSNPGVEMDGYPQSGHVHLNPGFISESYLLDPRYPFEYIEKGNPGEFILSKMFVDAFSDSFSMRSESNTLSTLEQAIDFFEEWVLEHTSDTIEESIEELELDLSSHDQISGLQIKTMARSATDKADSFLSETYKLNELTRRYSDHYIKNLKSTEELILEAAESIISREDIEKEMQRKTINAGYIPLAKLFFKDQFIDKVKHKEALPYAFISDDIADMINNGYSVNPGLIRDLELFNEIADIKLKDNDFGFFKEAIAFYPGGTLEILWRQAVKSPTVEHAEWGLKANKVKEDLKTNIAQIGVDLVEKAMNQLIKDNDFFEDNANIWNQAIEELKIAHYKLDLGDELRESLKI